MSLISRTNKRPPSQGGFLAGTGALSKDPMAQFLYRAKRDINFYFSLIGFNPTWQQKELVDAFVAGHPSIAVRSGKGP